MAAQFENFAEKLPVFLVELRDTIDKGLGISPVCRANALPDNIVNDLREVGVIIFLENGNGKHARYKWVATLPDEEIIKLLVDIRKNRQEFKRGKVNKYSRATSDTNCTRCRKIVKSGDIFLNRHRAGGRMVICKSCTLQADLPSFEQRLDDIRMDLRRVKFLHSADLGYYRGKLITANDMLRRSELTEPANQDKKTGADCIEVAEWIETTEKIINKHRARLNVLHAKTYPSPIPTIGDAISTSGYTNEQEERKRIQAEIDREDDRRQIYQSSTVIWDALNSATKWLQTISDKLNKRTENETYKK